MLNHRASKRFNPTETLTRGELVNELLQTWERELDQAQLRPVSPSRKNELRMIANAIEVLKRTFNVAELMNVDRVCIDKEVLNAGQ